MRFFFLATAILFLAIVVFTVPVHDGTTLFEAVQSKSDLGVSIEKHEPHKADVPLLEKKQETITDTGKKKETSPSEAEVGTVKTSQGEDLASGGSENGKNEIQSDGESSPASLRSNDAKPSIESFETLEVHGILEWTNYYRARHGLDPLSLDPLLTAAAKIKTGDMFENQYFKHVSPSGKDVSDLMKKVGYGYISVGENLALGDFFSSKDLVDAWMDSPGHRENILNPDYEEIGIGLKLGNFNEREAWISVQEFGRPRSSCPIPDDELKIKIEGEKELISNLIDRLDEMKEGLEEMSRGAASVYNEKVEDYNTLAGEVNALNQEIKTFIEEYNTQVESFNECANT